MKTLRSSTCLALAVLAAVALAGPAAAAESIPFRGVIEGDVTRTQIDDTHVLVEIDAGGAATLLGQFTVSIPHLVDRSNSTAVGTFLFTAANGDTVTAEFTGSARPSDIPGLLEITEVATITGGTGRFAGAGGGFTAVRLYDPVAGTTIGTFEGAISVGP